MKLIYFASLISLKNHINMIIRFGGVVNVKSFVNCYSKWEIVT